MLKRFGKFIRRGIMAGRPDTGDRPTDPAEEEEMSNSGGEAPWSYSGRDNRKKAIVQRTEVIQAEMIEHTLGKFIRARRNELEISQGDLAERISRSQGFISHIETGRRLPTVETFIEILDALNVSPMIQFSTREDISING